MVSLGFGLTFAVVWLLAYAGAAIGAPAWGPHSGSWSEAHPAVFWGELAFTAFSVVCLAGLAIAQMYRAADAFAAGP